MKKILFICLILCILCIVGLFSIDFSSNENSNPQKITYTWRDTWSSFSYNPHLLILTKTLENENGVFGGCFSIDNYKHLKQFNEEFTKEIACMYWDSMNNNMPILQWGYNNSEYIYKAENGKFERKQAPPQYFENDSHTLHSIEVFFANLPREKIIETMKR